MGAAARGAAALLARETARAKADGVRACAASVRVRAGAILAANRHDLAAATGLSPALRDRLHLDEARIEAIAAGLDAVAALPDPVGAVISAWEQPNGLRFERVRVPLGVIGIIYESRPNVTADAGALCLMAGNAVILRGGSEAAASNAAIHAALVEGLESAGLPAAAIQLVASPDRALVGAMLAAHGLIDVIIPRGGKGLVARVLAEARVPVLAHLDGNNHVYVDAAADPTMAKAIVLDAKMRRTGVCGAMETLLIDRAYPDPAGLIAALLDSGCEVRALADLMPLDRRLVPATAEDWDNEYLDAIAAVTLVDGVSGAIDHIASHGSHHTDAIVTADPDTAAFFLAEVDSAIVLHNASTQFADGGEFGFGTEIGIATGRLHARGPVALEGLTTYKNVVRGTGQVRG
ncbi:glutamate-5-semialdehyde dehydrogenase [Polymorphobacter sp. PAMC 29334]|uniref:glutamate-5-semialdehyde dehydrogenase n=1 Tax=Polymorphobacter sp. PAMC 29334 TaxID=2862331 RepID=UPI001C75E812|nr:glutamate-5-semialdehyde dehydrogenase [Polymorphobacter sp. PAMC 29334]QYE36656.1 glutamate-5-semialdehyde dehydrogenase [Polymorphobacter sp. PAMC 29334]